MFNSGILAPFPRMPRRLRVANRDVATVRSACKFSRRRSKERKMTMSDTWDPSRVLNTGFGFWSSKVLLTAVQTSGAGAKKPDSKITKSSTWPARAARRSRTSRVITNRIEGYQPKGITIKPILTLSELDKEEVAVQAALAAKS
jgi:hypothetical protein